MAKSGKRSKNIFFKVSVAFFALYLIVALVKLQGDIAVRRAELEVIQLANREQRTANNELERILAEDSQEEYIERIAREKLGFAYPEEQVIIDVSGS